MARELLELGNLCQEEGLGVKAGSVWGEVPWASVTHLGWGHSPILTLDGEALWRQSG